MNESFVDDVFIQSVVDQYSNMIFRVSYQYVGNVQDAEDVVQEVFLELLTYLCRAGFESDVHMKAWLIRVAINKSKNLARYNARRRRREASGYPVPAGQTRVEAHDLEEELNRLSAADREIVYLHYYEGYTAKEIAEFLGKTEQSVFKRLSRSRDKLKEFLSEEDET